MVYLSPCVAEIWDLLQKVPPKQHPAPLKIKNYCSTYPVRIFIHGWNSALNSGMSANILSKGLTHNFVRHINSQR